MIKVCHILDNLNVGGLEKIAVDIALNLKGYEHSIWCLKQKGEMAGELEARGISVKAFGFEGRLSFSALSRLARALRAGQFRIIHCHGMFPSIWARSAAILAGVPIRIVHCHSTYYGLSLKDRTRLWLLSFRTTAVIAVSQAVKKSLTKYLGIAGRRITVIYNGVDDIACDKSNARDEIRAGLGLAPDDFVVGCVGRLVGMKGHKYLIDAVSFVRRVHRSCRCVIIGEGPARQDIEALVKESGLEHSVLLLGMRRDIPALLSALDMLASPSTIKEGLPLVLAEGAAMGLPLVATDIGGSPEIVDDSVNGFIIAPRDASALADKISFLIEHPDARKAMAAQSRRIWAERFRKDVMMDKIGRIYRDALEKSGLLT